MRNTIAITTTIALVGMLTGCGLLAPKPTVYAGAYYNFEENSRATVASGTQGTQVVAVHEPIVAGDEAKDGTTPEAKDGEKVAKGTGGAMFSNVAVGDRTADIDAVAALEKIEKAKNVTAGQSMTGTKGNESPATSGEQTQNPTQTDSRETNLPVTIKGGAATTN